MQAVPGRWFQRNGAEQVCPGDIYHSSLRSRMVPRERKEIVAIDRENPVAAQACDAPYTSVETLDIPT
jgi:hypothetical protein